jgi:inhibitor of KinA sporulation pathway (predicted exonuclease)
VRRGVALPHLGVHGARDEIASGALGERIVLRHEALLCAVEKVVVDEYATFVRPVAFPRLSSFCTKLTSITQAQVDAADTFPRAFARFLTWMGADARLVTWGAFDIGQLRLDCDRHDMVFPERLAVTHLDLKSAFGRWKGRKRVAMAEALDLLGLPFEGHPHRGIDDARNLARLAQRVLRG